MLKLYDLTIEYKREPLGLDEVQPRFSWKLDTDHTGTVQTAYRIKVQRGGETVWDSGKTESAQSILVEYLGLNLEPRTEYTWNVTVCVGTTTARNPAPKAGLKPAFLCGGRL